MVVIIIVVGGGPGCGVGGPGGGFGGPGGGFSGSRSSGKPLLLLRSKKPPPGAPLHSLLTPCTVIDRRRV